MGFVGLSVVGSVSHFSCYSHIFFMQSQHSSVGSAGAAAAAAGVAALKACQIFVTHFCIHFSRGSPRQADTVPSTLSQLNIVIFFVVAVIDISLYIQ